MVLSETLDSLYLGVSARCCKPCDRNHLRSAGLAGPLHGRLLAIDILQQWTTNEIPEGESGDKLPRS